MPVINCLEAPHISEGDFLRAQERLSANMKQKSFFRERQFDITKGAVISQDFTGENLRRSYYIECKFKNANLTNTGLSGSIIRGSEFLQSTFVNTRMDSCEIDGCVFQNGADEQFMYVNFSKSLVFDTRFTGCFMDAANFTDTVFEGVIFEDCVWKSLALENAAFSNTVFERVDLRKLNFEFAQFNHVKMNDVRLPFPTIPYIVGGLSYLMTTRDNIRVSSAISPNGGISPEQYLTYLDDLEIFYIKTQNYYPLVNIYLAKGRLDAAFAAASNGVKSAIAIRSFRLVYYFCKLLQSAPFSTHALSQVYNQILKDVDTPDWRPQDYFNYSRYIDLIRNTLLCEQAEDSLRFSLYTNIAGDEYGKLTELLSVIEMIVQFAGDGEHSVKYYVEIRHGSPFELFINFFGVQGQLLTVLGVLFFAIWGSTFMIEKIQTIHGRYLDNKMKKLDYAQKKAQSQREADALADKGRAARQRLEAGGIIILSGGHTLLDKNNAVMDGDIRHSYVNGSMEPKALR